MPNKKDKSETKIWVDDETIDYHNYVSDINKLHVSVCTHIQQNAQFHCIPFAIEAFWWSSFVSI